MKRPCVDHEWTKTARLVFCVRYYLILLLFAKLARETPCLPREKHNICVVGVHSLKKISDICVRTWIVFSLFSRGGFVV